MDRREKILFDVHRQELGCLVDEGLDCFYPWFEEDLVDFCDDDYGDGGEDEVYKWTEREAREFERDFELAVAMFEFILIERRVTDLDGVKFPDTEVDGFLEHFKCSGYESAESLR